MHLWQTTTSYSLQAQAHTFMESPKCVNECYPEGASTQSFTPLKGCGMLPFSLRRGQSLSSLYSEFGLGTLSEWVVPKQLVCHSNLSAAAEPWIWSRLADSLPLWCGSLQWLWSLWHFMVAKFWGKGHLYCRHSGRKTLRCLQGKPPVSLWSYTSILGRSCWAVKPFQLLVRCVSHIPFPSSQFAICAGAQLINALFPPPSALNVMFQFWRALWLRSIQVDGHAVQKCTYLYNLKKQLYHT